MKIISGPVGRKFWRREFGMDVKRAKGDRWIFGVCGGLARSLGWSPFAVRLVTVLLALFIPGPNIVVVLAYVLLGYLLPETEEF